MENTEEVKSGRRPLGLYIHIPFCVKKCDYCDFLSAPAGAAVKSRYFDALLNEIRGYEGKTDEYYVPTIFIGGGTPSCVEAAYIRQVLDAVREVFEVLPGIEYQSDVEELTDRSDPSDVGEQTNRRDPSNNKIKPNAGNQSDIELKFDRVNRTKLGSDNDVNSPTPPVEITIEINPGTIDEEKLTVYREAGINRISFGLQSTENRELKLLGRIHTYEEFLKNYELARKLGFKNINIDLMSALPGQTLAAWEATLRRVADLQPEHISAYSLIIEEGTPFYERYREGCTDAVLLPDEDMDREIYLKTQEILHTYGYHRYEISNYSKEGYECRHNLSYWTGTEYLGLGLGAASLLAHTRFHNTPELEEYIGLCTDVCKNQSIAQLGQAIDNVGTIMMDPFGLRREQQSLSITMQMEEFMFLGLRITRGVRREEFQHRFGVTMNEIYGDVIRHLIDRGLLTEEGDRLYLTNYGIDVSNTVLAEFLLE